MDADPPPATVLLETVASWSAPVVLAVAALLLVVETGSLVGVLVPGTTVLAVLGLWSAAAAVPVVPVVAVAAAATVTGALRSHRAGAHDHRTGVPRHRTAAGRAAGRATRWYAARGPWGRTALLAAGHWASAARSVVPRVSGAAGVPWQLAAPVLLLSGTTWAAGLVLLSRQLGPAAVSGAGWPALALVAGLAALSALRTRRTRTALPVA